MKRDFLDLDEDGSGEISPNELKAILKDPRLKMSDADINNLVKEFDLDGSGGVDVGEFLILMGNRKNKQLKKMIHKAIILKSPVRRAFNEFDKNGDGVVNFQEFINAMRQYAGQSPNEKIKFLFKVYDKDGNRQIFWGPYKKSILLRK